MCIDRQSGSITVFLSIIMLIMITLAGVIVDAARINTAQSQIQRALETSASSTLAGYYTPLREEYGLFALTQNNKEELEEIITDYLSKNLMIDKAYLDENKIGKYVDLYDYKIEGIEVDTIFNLTENPVTKHQILQFMKYRAPKVFTQDFLEKLDLLKKSGSTSEVYKRKIEFEKELKKIENIQREIYKYIYGKYEERMFFLWSKEKKMEHFVRKLNEGECKRLIENYIQAVERHIELKKRLDNMEDKKGESEESKEKLKDKIRKAKREKQKKYNELTKDIGEYIRMNKNALDSIYKLIAESRNIRNKLDEYKEYLSKNKDNIMEASKKEFNEEIEKYDKLIPDSKREENKLEDIEKKIGANIRLLEGNGRSGSSILSLIEKIEPGKAKDDIDYIKSVEKDIIDKIRAYNNKIDYDYDLVRDRKSEYKAYDQRENNQEKGNRKIDINSKDKSEKSITISDEEYSILPSVLKKEIRKNKSNDNLMDSKGLEGIEFYEDEGLGFSESAFSYLKDITEKIRLKDIRDEIYINEYIMGTFKSYVSDINGEFDLRNINKNEKNTYFKKSEVEYILNGKRNEKMNQVLTDSKILLIRFGLNSIHTFTCENKKNIATATATAVAGLYTGGAGIPIIRTLILLGWSMGESIYDLDELKEGRKIALYKTEDDWKTDLKGDNKEFIDKEIDNEEVQNTSSDKKDFMNTSYQDYLRFLLLIQDQNKTINRIQDLIQLNIQKETDNIDYKLKENNTYIRVKAVVSIKYLFLTGGFIPENLKLSKNRHKFELVIYKGY